MSLSEPSLLDYETLGVSDNTSMEDVDNKYIELYNSLKNQCNDEILDKLYSSYSKITEYMYAIRDGRDTSQCEHVLFCDDTMEDNEDDIEDYTDDNTDDYVQNSTNFKCDTCHKTFASKQKLSNHKIKRFKCIPPEQRIDTDKFNCVCGRSYTKPQNLYRHKNNCNMCLINKMTLEAINDPLFILNNFTCETPTFDVSTFEKCIAELNTSTCRFDIEYFRRTKCWFTYKKLMMGLIKRVFFTNPSNYTFYIPNMSKDSVWIHQNGGIQTIDKNEFVQHLIDFVIEQFNNILLKTCGDNTNYDDFIKYHPIHFINTKLRQQDEDVCTQNLTKQVTTCIFMYVNEYKDDFKRIWTLKQLL